MDTDGLRQTLERIDGQGYRAYHELKGAHGFGRFTLYIDHVQGDPFAAPSRMRARVERARAGFPQDMTRSRVRRVALEDFLSRAFKRAISRVVKGGRGSGKSGFVGVDSGGQEIIERTAASVTDGFAEIRFAAGLPAQGRRCLGAEAAAMLLGEVPRLVDAALLLESLDEQAIRAHIEAAEDQDWLRGRLAGEGLVAFVAGGSRLPRESGVSDRPAASGGAIPFEPPPELVREFELPNRGSVSGMAIPEGVTLIVGGGYHGKSTLLAALQRGVYDHVPGDGRELAVCRADAVKIRAEDGRRVSRVDISPFINNLPLGIDTRSFSTGNASGSTSQAANIIEALEAGSRLLLIDEDTSATNFMIRDALMQQLITSDKEPITPFVDQVRTLYREHGVSTVLVMGGSGDYFEAADTVIAMEEYRPRVVTGHAREIALARRDLRRLEGVAGFGLLRGRVPLAEGLKPRRGRREKVGAKGLNSIVFGRQTIDLSAVEQVVDPSQTRAIAEMMRYGLHRGYFDGCNTLSQVLDLLEGDIAAEGIDIIASDRETAAAPGEHPGDLALPRRYEVAAALNRIRTGKFL